MGTAKQNKKVVLLTLHSERLGSSTSKETSVSLVGTNGVARSRNDTREVHGFGVFLKEEKKERKGASVKLYCASDM